MTAKKTTAKKAAAKPADTQTPNNDDAAETTVFEAPAGAFPAEYVEQVQAAEAAAQRSVVTVPDGDLPRDLQKALERRVEVNLAQADGKTVTRVGGTDQQVRDLESPYSKRKRRASA